MSPLKEGRVSSLSNQSSQSGSLRHADGRYSFFNDAHLYTIQQRERAFLKMLKREGIESLAGKVILDVGCGATGWFSDLIKYGADPSLLHGVDADAAAIDEARHKFPQAKLEVSGAAALPWPDVSFDVVLQSTLFSSVLDGAACKRMASEMLRVLRPGGIIVWYDLRVNNPSNPRVRGIRRRELEDWFAGCRVNCCRVTLAPPITRALIGVSWILCALLEKLPFLRTHYLATIKKL